MPWSSLLVVAATGIVSIACALLIRRVIGVPVLESLNDVAGAVYAVVGGVYAVLLAFVVIVVWERHTTTETRTEEEANALGDLFRDAQAFPPAARDSLVRAVDDYARIVIDDEWATMARGQSSPAAVRAYGELWQSYVRLEPGTRREALWYSTSLDRLNDLGDARRLRLLDSRARVPDVLWVVLLVGAAITIAFTFLFGTTAMWSHALIVAVVSVTVSLVLLLISILQHPFSGSARLEPTALRQIRAIIAQSASP
jgi:uncharacterized protein DUF4239